MEQTDVNPPVGLIELARAPRPRVAAVIAPSLDAPALRELLRTLPAGVAWVVLSLAGEEPSESLATLHDSAMLPILPIISIARLRPDHIYIAAPADELGQADALLGALAEAHADHAAAVLLAPLGAGVALGAQRLRQRGGVVLAADRADPPIGAAAGGLADRTLPAAAIPEWLIGYFARADTPAAPGPPGSPEEQALADLLAPLREHHMRDWDAQDWAAAQPQIARQMRIHAAPDLPAYLDLLRRQPAALAALLRDARASSAPPDQTHTRERLANEQLQTAHEEIQAAYEQLQSSREELQQINEELGLVNAKLEQKLAELLVTNDDLQNLIDAIDIATLFLDRELRISRFTPRALDLFNLIGSDVGRPLAHVTHRLADNQLIDDLQRVLDHAAPIEREIQTDAGRWYLARMAPYLTQERRSGGVVLTFVDLTERKQAEERIEAEVHERTAELSQALRALQSESAERERAERGRQEVLRQLVAAEETERRRISRELHDQMGQQITALLLGLEAIRSTAQARGEPTQRLERLQALANAMGQEMHQIALDLRPTALDDVGLSSALANYIDSWSQRTGIAAEFHNSGADEIELEPEVAITLYRVVIEALTNVVKHADATHVGLIIERRDRHLTLIVEDNGRGFEAEELLGAAEAAGRLGLLGMQERVAMVGGTLMIESSHGGGTTIFIRIPVA